MTVKTAMIAKMMLKKLKAKAAGNLKHEVEAKEIKNQKESEKMEQKLLRELIQANIALSI